MSQNSPTSPKKSEHRIQASLIKQLRLLADPQILYFAIPNGGLRNIRVAQRLKAEGVVPGIADLCFMLPGGRCAWLELKTKNGRLSDAQHGFKARCESLGHNWAVAKSVEEAIEHLKVWGVLKR